MRKKDNSSNSSWAYPNLKGATLLAQFQDFERQRGGKLSDQDIIGFLGINNAYALTLLNRENNFPDSLYQECSDLLEYFSNNYGGDKTLMRKIRDNWGPDGPLLFRLAAMAYQCEGEPLYDEDGMFQLSDDADRRCNVLTDYILSIHGERSLAYSCDGSSFVYTLPAHIPAQEMRTTEEEVSDIIANLLIRDTGSLVLRYSGFDPKRITVNGFQFTKGTIEIAEGKDLKRLCGINPDGVRHPQSDTIYQVPHLDLR